MVVKFNSLNRFEPPNLILCNPGSVYKNGEVTNVVGGIPSPEALESILNFNEISQISFRLSVKKPTSNDADEYGYIRYIYNSLEKHRNIFVENIGFFMITDVTETRENSIWFKDIEAKSIETEYENKDIPNIKEGKEDNDNTYKFDEIMDKLVAAVPYWTYVIEDADLVDSSNPDAGEFADLSKLYRTFEDFDTSSNCLSFMMTEIQNAFECILIFDIINRVIHCYSQYTYFKESGVYISHEDVVNTLKISENKDDLCTALSVDAGDNYSLNITNPLGTNVIYNYDHYLDWMSPELKEYITNWSELIESKRENYFLSQQNREALMYAVVYQEGKIAGYNALIKIYEQLINNINNSKDDTTVKEYKKLLDEYNKMLQENKGNPLVTEVTGDDGSKVSGSKINELLTEIGNKIADCRSSINNINTTITLFDVDNYDHISSDDITEDMMTNNYQIDLSKDFIKDYNGNNLTPDAIKTIVDNAYMLQWKSNGEKEDERPQAWTPRSNGTNYNRGLNRIRDLKDYFEALILTDVLELSFNNPDNPLSETLQLELNGYTVQASYSDEYTVLTDNMKFKDRMDQFKQLDMRARNQLVKFSTPTQAFEIDVESFLFAKEFQHMSERLEPGCIVNVELQDNSYGDDIAELMLKSITVNYEDRNMSLAFGNRYLKADIKSLFDNLLGNITKTSNSLEFVKLSVDKINTVVKGFDRIVEERIAEASKTIIGGNGGYLLINTTTDEHGVEHPNELLIMDNPDIQNAKKLWRWNSGGLGYSENGYYGNYGIAITNDGKINADMITTGNLTADIIEGGTIKAIGSSNGSKWDLTNGELIVDGEIYARAGSIAGFGITSSIPNKTAVVGFPWENALQSIAVESGTGSNVYKYLTFISGANQIVPGTEIFAIKKMAKSVGDTNENWRTKSETVFSVTSDGKLTAKNAVIEGSIVATSLTLGSGTKIDYSNINNVPQFITSSDVDTKITNFTTEKGFVDSSDVNDLIGGYNYNFITPDEAEKIATDATQGLVDSDGVNDLIDEYKNRLELITSSDLSKGINDNYERFEELVNKSVDGLVDESEVEGLFNDYKTAADLATNGNIDSKITEYNETVKTLVSQSVSGLVKADDVNGKIDSYLTSLNGDSKIITSGSLNSLLSSYSDTNAINAMLGSYLQKNDNSLIFVDANGCVKSHIAEKNGVVAEGTTGLIITNNGLLKASNAVIYGTLYSSEGKIAGWDISSGVGNGDIEGSKLWPYSISKSVSDSTNRYLVFLRAGGSSFTADNAVIGVKEMPIANTNTHNNWKDKDVAKYNFLVTADGSLTATKATITGKITAKEGSIGGFTIESNCLKSGDPGTSNKVYLNPSGYDGSATIAGQTVSNPTLTVGSKFGVSRNGDLYASSVDLTGKISATSGSIAQWNITGSISDSNASNVSYGPWPNSLTSIVSVDTKDGTTVENNKYLIFLRGGSTSSSGNVVFGVKEMPKKTNNVTNTDTHANWNSSKASYNFRINARGEMWSEEAHIKGEIEAKSGVIAGWTIAGSGAPDNGFWNWSISNVVENKTGSTVDDRYATFLRGKNSNMSSSNYAIGIKKMKHSGTDEKGPPYASTSENWSNNADYVFGVTAGGKLLATNAEITGKVTASSGSIASWTITDSISTSANNSGVTPSDTASYGPWPNSLTSVVSIKGETDKYLVFVRGGGLSSPSNAVFGVRERTNSGAETYNNWRGDSASYNFYIAANGHVYAKDINISGGELNLKNTNDQLYFTVKDGVCAAGGMSAYVMYVHNDLYCRDNFRLCVQNPGVTVTNNDYKIAIQWHESSVCMGCDTYDTQLRGSDVILSNYRLSFKLTSGSTTSSYDVVRWASNKCRLSNSSLATIVRGTTVELGGDTSSVIANGTFTAEKTSSLKGTVTFGNSAVFEGAYGIYLPNKNNVSSVALRTYDKRVSLGIEGTVTRLYGTVQLGDGTSVSSDARLKYDIEPLDSNRESFFKDLRPVNYKYKNGESGRTHTGFIAQEVIDAANSNGISDMDLAAFVKFENYENFDEYGRELLPEEYSLRYVEFVALNTHMIQKLMKRVDELESELAEYKNNI